MMQALSEALLDNASLSREVAAQQKQKRRARAKHRELKQDSCHVIMPTPSCQRHLGTTSPILFSCPLASIVSFGILLEISHDILLTTTACLTLYRHLTISPFHHPVCRWRQHLKFKSRGERRMTFPAVVAGRK